MHGNTYLPEGSLKATAENTEYISSRQGLERAAAAGKILEATAVMCDSELNLTVDLPGMKGIIPRSEISYSPEHASVKDIAAISRVGKTVCFKVIGFSDSRRTASPGGEVAVLSRREAQSECMREYLTQLIPGDIIPSKVTHLEPFGAFVDIGCGVVSLLSIDCISVSRISHPRDRFAPGDRIRTIVKSVDSAGGRIYVSHKELLGSWEENASRFSVGQTVTGIIRSIEDYGIFVELAPNLAGLAELRDGAHVGMSAAVYIKNIIPGRMKIKLVLIDCGEVPVRKPCEYFVAPDCLHIPSWRYSPPECMRVTESVFEAV